MKRYFLVIQFFIYASTSLFSQNSYLCKDSPISSNTAQAISQPTNCNQLLKDFAPEKAGDRTLIVNVNFWVLAPTNTATGMWTSPGNPSTLSDATTCIANANHKLANLNPIPQLTTSALTNYTFSNCKVQLQLKTFSIVPNDMLYANANYTASQNLVPGYNFIHDGSAINIIAGIHATGTFVATGSTGTYVAYSTNIYGVSANAPVVPAGKDYSNTAVIFLTSTNNNISNHGADLAHEVGHILGLSHPTGPFTNPGETAQGELTYLEPKFGCCSYLETNDHVMESYGCYYCIVNQGCGTPGGSNNLMCIQNGCQEYLSPLQAAVMHYNLTVHLPRILTSSGYTAATTVNHAFDYTVSTNEIWQNSDRYMKGDILVKAGKSLTIKCGVAMTNGAKIVVEKTGLLVVDGGTITNISGRTWDGIHVYGDPTLAQTYNTSNSSFAQHQGMVRLLNGAVISHAFIGVRNHYGNNTNTSTMGGMIFAVNATFLNNRIDVQLLGTNSGNGGVASATKFYGCTFIENGGIGDGYKPVAHVNLYNSKGSCYYGCTFQNTLYYNYGCGIKSVNSTCLVDRWTNQQAVLMPSIFTALETGIFINNWNPLLTPVIRHSLIKDYFKNGIYSMNNNSLAFQTNTIVPYAGYSTPNISGVYLNNCKYYKIKYNLFNRPINVSLNKFDPALAIYKSQAGAHEVFGNTFSNQYIGVNVMDNNGNNSDGLKINCNDFHQVPNGYDVALSHTVGLNPPRVMKTQGMISTNPAPTATNLVRNIYGAICSTQNKWYISSVSPTTIDHGCNINTVTAVTHPTASGCKSPFLNSVQKNISLNYSAHCPGTTQSAGGTGTNTSQKLENMNSYIFALKSDNDGDKNHFEIQSTVAGKMGLFLNDTLGPQIDSVISILQNNQGDMEDADLQLIYAYMAAGNFTAATSAISALPGSRSDWKSILEKVLELEQDGVEGIYRLNTNTEDRLFFLNYATSDTLEGKALAQAILKEACDSSYTEPHALPESESARPENITGMNEALSSNSGTFIEVFPNPTQNGVTVRYQSQSADPIRLELKDLLGKEIFVKFINGGEHPLEIFLPMELYSRGMYLLMVSRVNESIFKTKIIKE